MVKVSRIGLPGKALPYFMGLGVGLAIVWEVSNGHPQGTANNIKPKELIEWARDLIEPKIIIPN